jgi:hypothetical protein
MAYRRVKTKQDRQTDVTATYLQATSALQTEALSIQFSEIWDLSVVRNLTNQTDAHVWGYLLSTQHRGTDCTVRTVR